MQLLCLACILGTSKIQGKVPGPGSFDPLPKFSLIERSMDEIPNIAIAFPDGSTDTLVLEKYYSNDDDRKAGAKHCNFIGHLAKETDACVGVTGCSDSGKIEFTIMSSHLRGSPMFRWTKGFGKSGENKVERVIHPYMVNIYFLYWNFDPSWFAVFFHDKYVLCISNKLFKSKFQCGKNTT